ncbi:class I SAM-dependent methyltransferase [Nocardioides iriomotensis]|uniref:Class I SAM-dependent methyltransferase n=1 Tax=Nocardioides iriomotensis TaxID=715784 RepID=A0A4Q5IUZ4_9ACTN|nr:class I SAM-dependent methyltransferase [Nocardioides iriomotensis]RYU08815.1 class I SAM-dependent methyltransferase [Nocardioides iriomotensis]
MTRWSRLSGKVGGEQYAARFAALAARGEDVHGEAAFVDGLVEPGSRILDAGCGTGRVGIRLAELGHTVVGVDVDASMLAVARREAPLLAWHEGDLAHLPEPVAADAPYDAVVLAGNVVPLLAEDTLPAVLPGLARLLRPGGLLVAGFGLDDAHLPPGCPVTPLADYDAAAEDAGLTPVDRFSTWQAAPFDVAQGYVVVVYRA